MCRRVTTAQCRDRQAQSMLRSTFAKTPIVDVIGHPCIGSGARPLAAAVYASSVFAKHAHNALMLRSDVGWASRGNLKIGWSWSLKAKAADHRHRSNHDPTELMTERRTVPPCDEGPDRPLTDAEPLASPLHEIS
ncbi:hypothetical protein CBOM_07673 [Ceraceosorus bombacis]|uniref:Uncharacterized protein n=1 Tax=Ceraceosorus bombacis TaxID=401625 RepID=A0A0P1BLV0_9BASI|nr:hypothetical protein CBOM_07673 [Ceraceosorus bombacis]